METTKYGRRMRFKTQAACLILFLGFQSIRAYGQVVSTWNGGTGNWSVSTNWSPAAVPNNGGGTTYSVSIGAPSSVVTMDILDDTIDNLALAAGNSLTINAGDSLSLVSGTSSNSGTLTVGDGVLTNDATLNNASGATVAIFGGAANFTNYGTITNAGTIGTEGAHLYNFGTLINTTGATFAAFFGSVDYNSGTLYNYGNLYDQEAVHNNPGAFLIDYGTVSMGSFGFFANSGTFLIVSGGSVNGSSFGITTNDGLVINNGTFNNSLRFTNSGTLISNGTLVNDDPYVLGGGTINSSGRIVNFGRLNTAGTINNSGTFTNLGAVAISSTGLLTTSTNYTQTAGSTLVNGTLTASGGAIVNILGGTLGGTGTINGGVFNKGTMMPGGTVLPGDSPGTLTIFGNYEQAGTGDFNELMNPLAHSLLKVNGNVTLDPGSLLDITLLGGFNPLGQTFDIMDYSSLTGKFVNGSNFWDDGYLWDVSYGQNQIDVTAVQAPEPGTLSLVGFGLVALILYSWRTRPTSLQNGSRRSES